MRLWAKAISLSRTTTGSYTEGKFYEVFPEDHDGRAGVLYGDDRFDILNDDGDPIWCSWADDPDVTWERHEFPVGVNPNCIGEGT
ncbi:hypothetical protein [Novosphingobium meiothermophilum]|uniref:hypothetical protein n=1 Tax=Novosphingobium meiothermophilum TaxID=2202251 RepID=UPI000D6E9836|nr:hypothetical protein [Novosphingobium meiothermophilum]